MTEDEIKELWIYGQAMWPSFEIPASEKARAAAIHVWTEHLGDLPQRIVQGAFAKLSTREFMPSLGQLREAALDLQAELNGIERAPEPDEAWAEVMAMISRVGHYRMPEWSHEVIGLAIDTMGWRNICMSTEPQVSRAQFMKIYAAAAQRERRRGFPDPPILVELRAQALMDGAIKRALGEGDVR